MSNNTLEGLNARQLHQMVFIYNAVMAGWTVKRIEEAGNFHFRKRIKSQPQRQEYEADGFLQRFLQNMQRLQAYSQPRSSPSSVNITSSHLEEFELPLDQDIPL